MAWIAGILVFLVLPWMEFWLMMGLGFSLATAVALGVVTAAVGWWHAWGEGLDLWTELESDIQNQRVPTAEALDAMLVMIGGVLLIVPGIVTDMMGGVLLVPAIRRIVMPTLRSSIRRLLL